MAAAGVRKLEGALDDDLTSFGRGFTVLKQDIAGLEQSEPVVGRRLQAAAEGRDAGPLLLCCSARPAAAAPPLRLPLLAQIWSARARSWRRRYPGR